MIKEEESGGWGECLGLGVNYLFHTGRLTSGQVKSRNNSACLEARISVQLLTNFGICYKKISKVSFLSKKYTLTTYLLK